MGTILSGGFIMNTPQSRSEQIAKLFRFAATYGWARAINKAVARTRPRWLRTPFAIRRTPFISIIGCGQFAFSSVCFFLRKHKGNAFLSAFDIDNQQAESLGRYYGFRNVACSPTELLDDPALRVLYITSNHASHTPYAIEALRRNKVVYSEKPIAVTRQQLGQLSAAVWQSSGQLFAGYNRPYSKAIQLLGQHIKAINVASSFSISYVINGHQIPADHWYRNPEEGSRIFGNLGHWIDLTVHLFCMRDLPDWIDIQIAYANSAEPDDNLVVTFTTDRHDLVTMMLTSRSEPFEGISEAISVQYHTIIARIDDFRQLTIWQGARKNEWRFFPKDVGHERAILQPFCSENRDWQEVEMSTLLTLFIRDMVLDRRTSARFSIQEELIALEAEIHQAMIDPFAVHEDT
ncbi:Gfo/Idh/MocA family protein [Spirosoma terrae]|uniref:Gfo/Idh/MocA family oxidoreductase n=1 Tax=Spirosoma terrae TaxID=1968276 RepID=A0A6L9LFH8_9BACT|nr:Gfo/Idh/MocA family oxidoreductase [Spirosoma terrae]NDU99254.1 Gfo/Idh/MocA family oxidoreductase [Spirosoma terrae]